MVVQNGGDEEGHRYGPTTTFRVKRDPLCKESEFFRRELDNEDAYLCGELLHLNTYCGVFQLFIVWLLANNMDDEDSQFDDAGPDSLDDFVLEEYHLHDRVAWLWELGIALESR